MIIKIKFLGSGVFAEPVKEVIKKRFGLASENCDLQVVANYGRILSGWEINEPKYGTIDIHPSLLPKYRGAAPLQTAVLNGDKATGVSIIKMTKPVDAGPILAQEAIDIYPNDTSLSLAEKAGRLAAKMLPYVVVAYISGSISAVKQDESQASYTKKLRREDGLLDLDRPVVELERKIRAYTPWPGAYIKLPDGKRLIIHKARVESGKLAFDEVQLEGKKPMPFDVFRRGYRGDLNP